MQDKMNREEDSMSLEGFAKVVSLDISRRLGTGFRVMVEEVIKNNNRKLKALTIREDGSNLAPTIYLDWYYEGYRSRAITLGMAEEKILECYFANRVAEEVDVSMFMDWNRAKDRIVFKLINYERNMELLGQVPHFRFLDLAIVFLYLLETGEDATGSASIMIHNNHLEMWNQTRDDLYEVAKLNTPRLLKPEIRNMTEVLKELMVDELMGIEVKGESPMYLLTNQNKYNGAVCMLYPDVFKGFSEKMQSDIYIIPSSVDEVLLIPADERLEDGLRDLSEMVKEVNANQLRLEDILSDHAYYYSRATQRITM